MALRASKEAPSRAASAGRPPSAAQLPPWLRHSLRTLLHWTLDAGAIVLSFRLAYQIRFDWAAWTARFPVEGLAPGWPLYQRILLAVVPLWLTIFWYSSRLYQSPWLGLADRFLQIVKGCVLGIVATLVATYIYGRLEYSRMAVLLVFPLSVALVTLAHTAVLWLDEWMARHEAAKPVLLVGGAMVAQEIKERIRSRHPGARVRELRELPEPKDLARLLSQESYFELILLTSSVPHERVLAAAEVCDAHGLAFKMVPDLLELRLGEVQMDHSLGLPAYRIQHSAMTPLNFAAKRAFDLVFGSFVLALVSLPLAAIAVLIKLDSAGPVLYRQRRFGYKGRVFAAFKFRTMVADAESRIGSVQALNDQAGGFFKAKSDPRVTRVGRFLRRYSLDEFPQFLNVIRGEMSVVGPRPLALTTGEVEALEAEFGPTARKRMNILPGITGLWQVSGRSDVSSEQRFSLDLFYIEHWSLGLDLVIILKTVPAMLFGKGAY